MFPGSWDKKGTSAYMQFDTVSTYSFSFFSCNVDLMRWKAVNVPGLSDIELKTFWHELPARLVAYRVEDPEIEREMAAAGKRKEVKPRNIPHTGRNKQYFFAFEVTHDGSVARWKDASH